MNWRKILLATAFISLCSSISYADDWDNFYNKFSTKALVVIWRHKLIEESGQIKAEWEHEFGYTMPNSNSIREFTRNTDLKNNGTAVARWDETIKRGDYRQNGREFFNTYDIEGNQLIIRWNWMVTKSGTPSTVMQSIIITPLGNGCKARFEDGDLRLKGKKYEVTVNKCVIVDK